MRGRGFRSEQVLQRTRAIQSLRGQDPVKHTPAFHQLSTILRSGNDLELIALGELAEKLPQPGTNAEPLPPEESKKITEGIQSSTTHYKSLYDKLPAEEKRQIRELVDERISTLSIIGDKEATETELITRKRRLRGLKLVLEALSTK